IQPPMMTVGQPGGMTLPTGLGIGATQAGWVVMSLTRAAGIPPIMTELEPFAIIPGPPGTHDASTHGVDWSVTRAAGRLPISTVGQPLMMGRGIAGCGAAVGTSAAGWIGA